MAQKAFRAALKVHHPDVNGNAPLAAERTRRLLAAAAELGARRQRPGDDRSLYASEYMRQRPARQRCSWTTPSRVRVYVCPLRSHQCV